MRLRIEKILACFPTLPGTILLEFRGQPGKHQSTQPVYIGFFVTLAFPLVQIPYGASQIPDGTFS